MRVCIVGLGKIGLASALYAKEQGQTVYGYDINFKAVDRAIQSGIPSTACWNSLPQVDGYIVCIFIGLNDGLANLTELLNPIDKNAMVSVESTIPFDAVKLFSNRNVAYVPHRWYEKEQAMHGVNQLRVIGASNGLALNFWKAFYSNIHIPLHAVSLDVAVMTKITENAYRYLQIAFAEELKLSCKKLGVDFEVLKNACNTKWNIKILDALTGIGGTCLPKDMEFYSQAVGNSTLCWAARIVNENYVKETNK